MSKNTGEKKLKLGRELRVKLYDGEGHYISQVLISSDKNSEKKLTVYYFSDNTEVKDCI